MLKKLRMFLAQMRANLELKHKINFLESRIAEIEQEIREFQSKYGEGDSYGAKVYLVDLRSELKSKTDELNKLIATRG
ncbi:MAG: hypothetical protein GY751_23975 [Bacteroidetes bacterium]|nr:hypothetical protein [Bacteroidota bacterium]